MTIHFQNIDKLMESKNLPKHGLIYSINYVAVL